MEKNDDEPYINEELFNTFNTESKVANIYENKKRKSKKFSLNKRSNKRKWIYTILLIVLSPFTVLISLLFIPLVWSNRFTLTRGGSSKLTKNKVREPHYLRWAIVAFVAIVCSILYKPVTDRVALHIDSSNASEAIKDIADHSGLNNVGKLIFYKAHPELVNADTITTKCPIEDQTTIEYGCYIPRENKIYILEVVDSSYKDVEYTTAAHETLHAIYFRLDTSERQTVNSLIMQFYDDNSNTAAIQLHETIKPYGNDEFVIDDELHSFIGSETPDYNLSQPLTNYFKKYFSDRSETVNANMSFNSKIENEISSLDAESRRLDALSVSIDNYKIQYLDKIESYLPSNRYYGDIDRYNQNVDAYNKNLISYKSQVSNYNNQIATYNENVDKFNAVLRAFYPTKAQFNTK